MLKRVLRRRKRCITLLALFILLTSFLGSLWPSRSSAAIAVVTTAGAAGNSAGWTNSNNANGLTDDNVYATAAPAARNTTITGDWTTYGFDTSLPTDIAITKVEIIPQYKVSVTNSVANLDVQAIVGGSACNVTAASDTSEPLTDTEFLADVTSCRTWTRNNLLDANFRTRVAAVRANSNNAVTFSMDYVKVRVTYNTPTYNQVSYRWYENADLITPGTPWAAQNTAATLYAPTDKIRLRYLLRVSDVNLTATSEQFKLQFGQKAASCAVTTYADVTAGTAIAFNDNATPANDTTISTTGNDPTDGANTVIAEKYAEASPFSTPNAVNTSQDGMWDISLKANSAPANTTYCFRVIKNSGTVLDTYTTYPELVTSPPAALDTDIVNASGVTVASPTFAMSTIATSFDCQTTTGTMGTSSQRVRVRNTTAAPAWSLSIAATSGSTALWTSGLLKYDFNDASGSPAGCAAGLDSDSYAGRMTIDPSSGTLSARSTCNTTGVTKGSSTAFTEGTVNSVTILSASASAQIGCYWELTGISVSQKVPKDQTNGSYNLSLTMTVVAN